MKSLPVLFSAVVILITSMPAIAGSHAKASDIKQAQEFLSSLPTACSKSVIRITDDGSVKIGMLCIQGQKRVDGLIVIKDGVETRIR